MLVCVLCHYNLYCMNVLYCIVCMFMLYYILGTCMLQIFVSFNEYLYIKITSHLDTIIGAPVFYL